jgi:hypothetical protein
LIRRTIPDVGVGKLWALTLTPDSIYEIFSSNLSGQKNLTRFDIDGITDGNKDIRGNEDNIVGAFFDMNIIKKICRGSKLTFSHRFLFVNG